MNGVEHEILQAQWRNKTERDNVESVVKLITEIELFGVTEILIDEARPKSKRKKVLKKMYASI